MKKTIILILCSLIASIAISQDYRADVKTTKGSNVAAWITRESSIQTRTYLDAYVTNNYPNAQQIKTYDNFSSSRRFNCHGYAWHMSELTNPLSEPRWIGYYAGNTDEHIYWQDGSYIEVSQEVYPGKVSWASGDHSGVTTNEKGWFISKWNEYPLLKHKWDDSPYGTTNLKYYKMAVASPTISGPSTICDQATYTINNLPEGAAVEWSSTPNAIIIASNDSMCIIKQLGAFSDDATLSAKISYDGSILTSLQKDIYMEGPPNQKFISVAIAPYFCTDHTGSNYGVARWQRGEYDKILEYEWDVTNNYFQIVETCMGYDEEASKNAVLFVPTSGNIPTNSVYVAVRARNKYGWGTWTAPMQNVSVRKCSTFSFNISPNPAITSITIQLEELNEVAANIQTFSGQKANKTTSSGISEIQLWSTTSLLRTHKTDQTTYQISVSDLPKGIYIVRVIKDGKTYTQKLIKN